MAGLLYLAVNLIIRMNMNKICISYIGYGWYAIPCCQFDHQDEYEQNQYFPSTRHTLTTSYFFHSQEAPSAGKN